MKKLSVLFFIAVIFLAGCSVPAEKTVKSGGNDSYQVMFLGDIHYDGPQYHAEPLSERAAKLHYTQWKGTSQKLLAAASKQSKEDTAFVVQLGDIINGDCDNAELQGPKMVITSSESGAKINAGGKSVLLGYGSTEFYNVEINVTEIKSSSYTTFNVYGDLTLGEGTVVNVEYLGTSLISNNGKQAIVIDGAKINIGTFKVNGGAMISLAKGTTLAIEDTDVTVGLDTTYTSYFISCADNATIADDCTFDVTDADGAIYDVEYKPDANVGAKYAWTK